MQLSELALILGTPSHTSDAQITGFSIDTRTLKVGEVYIALKGPRFDGHDFCQDAIEKGACALIVSRPIESTVPLFFVEDTEMALGLIGTLYRQLTEAKIIALTGSSGKSTTKAMIAAILAQAGSSVASQGNFNNAIGVPLSLMHLLPTHEYAVFELGANHIGEIAYTTHLVEPDVALITNIGTAHIGEFGGQEAIAQAKAEIFQGLSDDGFAVINADDDYADFLKLQANPHRILTFGLGTGADYTYVISEQRLVTPEGDIQCPISLPGEHNIVNAIAAAACTHALGVSLAEIKTGLASVAPVDGRLCPKYGLAGSHIIDDTYNANLNSVIAGLKVLAQYPHRRFLVLGDLAELGEHAKTHHHAIGEAAKSLGIDEVYTCGEDSVWVSRAFSSEKGYHFDSQQALIETLLPKLAEDITILVKGSRGAHMESVVEALTQK